ncbi:MAG: hypothetical protein RBU37_22765 [Myxococcota bacterium]|nr:hypothetical protein [Myxococcota bacterium]
MFRRAVCVLALVSFFGCAESADSDALGSEERVEPAAAKTRRMGQTQPESPMQVDQAEEPTQKAPWQPPAVSSALDERLELSPIELGGSCALSCVLAADCVSAFSATAITDDDNYACDQGRCTWLGCLNDGECDALFGAGTRHCVAFEDEPASCIPPCEEASDCVSDSGTAMRDADNFACEAGACRYLGCLSDEECEQSLSADFACVTAPGQNVRSCLPRCESDRDCALGNTGWIQDRCLGGVCVRAGCQDDASCQAANDERFACFQ